MARPSEYKEETAITICTRLAAGEPLVKICREEELPHVSTVYRWLAANDSFRDMYARAREDQADTLADQIIDIADEDPAVVFEDKATVGGEEVDIVRIDSAAVQHQRLRVEARKWIAAKLKPRKYGEKIELSGDKDNPIIQRVERVIVEPKAA